MFQAMLLVIGAVAAFSAVIAAMRPMHNSDPFYV